MPFRIIRNDITRVAADAIVNTANPEPVVGSGTDSAVYAAAGKDVLLAARKKIGRIARGEAAVTPAFGLNAKYIIHTVGPVWRDGNHGEAEKLRACYRKPLLLAEQLDCESIAFPLISTGVYGFPKALALKIAEEEITGFLENSEMEITLVVFDRASFEISAARKADISRYIDEHYVADQAAAEYFGKIPPTVDVSYTMPSPAPGAVPNMAQTTASDMALDAETEEALAYGGYAGPAPGAAGGLAPQDWPEEGPTLEIPAAPAPRRRPFLSFGRKEKAADQAAEKGGKKEKKKSLAALVGRPEEDFSTQLFRLIDERGLSDPDVYKKANITKQVFSKIRSKKDYQPSRNTALALALALELNMDQTTDLLSRAGYAFSPSNKTDIVIRYCIENRIFRLFDVDSYLLSFDLPTLSYYGKDDIPGKAG